MIKKYIIGLAVALSVITIVLIAIPRQRATDSAKVVTHGSYVALGDSVAAGVGLKYDSDPSACDRTNQSYPNIIANKQQYKLSNVACSGATLSSGITGKQDVNDLLVASQLQQLFNMPTPELITITIGANDANWTGVLQKCYTSECGSSDDTSTVQASLATVKTNLQFVLSKLQQHYTKSPPKVLVTGYHQVFPENVGAGCVDLTGIDPSELMWGRQLQININTALRDATQGSGATYVPIDFSGHELCTSDSWVQGLSDPQPYHPTAAGQAAFAQQIISAVSNIK